MGSFRLPMDPQERVVRSAWEGSSHGRGVAWQHLRVGSGTPPDLDPSCTQRALTQRHQRALRGTWATPERSEWGSPSASGSIPC
jgi:hypothetical protein